MKGVVEDATDLRRTYEDEVDPLLSEKISNRCLIEKVEL